MSVRPLTTLAALASALLLVGCGGSSDAWRSRAVEVCRTSAVEATAHARGAGRPGLARAAADLRERGASLGRIDGPDGLEGLADATRATGAALADYAAAPAPAALRRARAAEARAARAARTLDLPACG